MKAAVLQKNGVLETAPFPIPLPRPDECLIRIKTCGICASDVSRTFDGGAYTYPLIMGHEMAGDIDHVGPEVTGGWKKGDRVAVFPLIPCGACSSCREATFMLCEKYDYFGSRRHGGLSEYLAVKSWNLLRIPAGVSDEQAALVEPIAVALHALRRGGILSDGERAPVSQGPVVILGAGFLGQVAARILSIADPSSKPLIIDRNEFKLKIARAAGAETLLLADDAAWQNFVTTRAAAFPFVLEASGSPQTYAHSLALAARRGTVVWMGNIAGDLTLSKTLVSSVLRKELRIVGTWNAEYHPASSPSDWTESLRLLQAGLRVDDLITHRVSLDELPALMTQFHNHKTGKGRLDVIKAVVNVGNSDPR